MNTERQVIFLLNKGECKETIFVFHGYREVLV
jgi:hypothetical protein